MPSVLVISSFVAASSVGGGLAPLVLAPLGIDTVLAPTTLLGRHPGWGKPGGGMVPAAQLQGVLEGIEANGLFATVDAVLTGYLASPEQVEIAARAVDQIRVTPRQGPPAWIVVDPIMGDADTGLYIPEETASALMRNLAPLADLVACNAWEFSQLVGADVEGADQIARHARDTGRDWLVTSVGTAEGLGALLVDGQGARLALSRRIPGRLPRGPGDLLKLRFVGGCVSGDMRDEALQRSVGLVSAVLQRAVSTQAPELPLVACRDLLAHAPMGWIQSIEG